MSIWNFPETLSQRILVGTILVGRLGVGFDSVVCGPDAPDWSKWPQEGDQLQACDRRLRDTPSQFAHSQVSN